jgi:hypothetical protein
VRGDPLARSRYVRRVWAEKNREDLARHAQSILENVTRPWQAVIIADEIIARRMIAALSEDALKRWQPGALQPEARAFSLGKFAFESLHRGGQFPVPPSRVCRSAAEIHEFGREFGWPVMLKPDGDSGGNGVVKLDGPASAANEVPLNFPVLAQKCIHGQRGVVDMLCAAGRPLAWLASYSTKRSRGEFSPSTARLFRPMPELQPLVEQIAAFTRFDGFCGFDWIRETATGRRYLIEFHPRPPSGFRFGRQCRVDFPAAIAAWLNREGASFPTQVQPHGYSVAAHYFSCDLLRCFRQRDWAGLKSWLPGSGACHDFFRDDVSLVAAWVWHRCRRRFGPDGLE